VVAVLALVREAFGEMRLPDDIAAGPAGTRVRVGTK
jgi:hypothetical protein